MPDISKADTTTAALRRVDLNLLVVLDVLLQERSVTRAAARARTSARRR